MGLHPIQFDDLIAYAAGELGAEESSAIARHVATCAECTLTVTRFQIIGETLRADNTEAPSARAILRAQKLFSQRQRPRQPSWIETGLFRLFQTPNFSPATVILVLIVFNLLLYAGFALVMAQNATPGDWFYPLKTALEDLDLKTTRSDSGKMQLQLGLAGKRVDETRIQVERQEYQRIPETTTAYESHIINASDFLNNVFQRDLDQAKRLAQLMDQDVSRYISVLDTLSQGVPDDIKPAFQRAIATSGSAISIAIRIISTPVLTAQRTPTPSVVARQTPTLVIPPAPSNTFVVPIPPTGSQPGSAPTAARPQNPTTAPPGSNRPPTAVPKPPTAVEPVQPPPAAERCQASAQGRRSGFIKNVVTAQGTKGPNGDPDNPTEEFKPNSKIYAIAQIQNAPANTRFKALWCVTDVGKAEFPDTKIAEAEIATFGTRNVEFTLMPTKGWAVGRYRVEIFVNGVLDTVKHFNVK